MKTYIRDPKDSNELSVYTEDLELYEELRLWKSCRHVTYYEEPRADLPDGINGMKGIDMYFPKEMKEELLRACAISRNRETDKCERCRRETRLDELVRLSWIRVSWIREEDISGHGNLIMCPDVIEQESDFLNSLP